MPAYRQLFTKYSKYLTKNCSSPFFIGLSRQKLILPFYHSISDIPLDHIRHLYQTKNIKQFINDLDFLLRYFKPIDYDEFRRIKESGTPPHTPSFLLSFDDGLREFHDVISPILIKKGIPAICFLNAAFIDNQELFFRYKASLLVHHLQNSPTLLDSPECQRWMSEEGTSQKDIYRYLLTIRYHNRTKFDQLAEFCQYSFSDYLTEYKPYLNSDQIKSLISQGFIFGGHSHDHPEYRYLDLEDQIKQTKKGMDILSSSFNISEKAFSFPFSDYGVENAFFKKIKENYIVEYSFGCAGQKLENNNMHTQRIPFEVGSETGENIYKAEMLYFAAKGLIGKNKIMRR